MSTNDVPGANPVNKDILATGCWAEFDDGSLLFVKGNEQKQVVYELYDISQSPPVSYQDAMEESAFKKQFSFPPIGNSKDKLTWHDKTPFPWNRVMQSFSKPRPEFADVQDTLSAAARVAASLRLRAHEVTEENIEPKTEQTRARRGIMSRLSDAFAALRD